MIKLVKILIFIIS